MTVPLRVTCQQFTIELERCGGFDKIDAILLQNRLEQHDTPAALALLQKEIETSGANDIAQHTVNRDPIRNRLLRLSDSAIALEIDGGAAEKVQEAHAFVVASLARLNEFLEAALNPHGDHPAFFVP